MQIYISMNGQQMGPYTAAQIHSMWNNGNLTANAQYYVEGMASWGLVNDFVAAPNVPQVLPRISWKVATRLGDRPEMQTDGTISELIDCIASGINRSEYVLLAADKNSGILKFETPGITWRSWAGEVVSVSFNLLSNGLVCATFQSRTKPQGLLRLESQTNAEKYFIEIWPYISLRERKHNAKK